MGNCLGSEAGIDNNVYIDGGGGRKKDVVKDVIFFPDEKLPCKFHFEKKKCNRTADKCHYSHSVTNLMRFLAYLKKAKKSLDICVFTITCDQIANEILAAHHRGVEVRIITDDDQSYSKGSDIQSFRDDGIFVRDDNSPMHMHHKFCIIDKTILLNGSFNWTRQAIVGNRENVVVSEGSTTGIFLNYFNDLWQEYKSNARGKRGSKTGAMYV